ncbi:IS66 family element, transposase [mine drainage metagenome]|uniref:IS66 family element, transposase n=1 Tax=mine drainage metagenome TaxID=410659 RepID=T0ZZU1_9ZZZZ
MADISYENESERWRFENERLTAENADQRIQIENQRIQIVELKAQIAVLIEKVATLSKLLFGKSSEKEKSEDSGSAVEKDTDNSSENINPEKRNRGQQPGSTGHGRRDYSNLKTEEVIHDVPEDEQVCPDCNAPYADFGEERAEQIDWQVSICRVVHKRKRYKRTCKCPVRSILVAPIPPKAIPKGMFTTSFLARLLIEKYVLGRPLERIVVSLRNDGFNVAKGSLVGTLKALSALLAPLNTAICARNVQAAHLHIDETSWNVFETVDNKANNRWWLWTFVAADTVVFLIDPTRSTKVVSKHLGIDITGNSLEVGNHLLISSDFYTVYQSLNTLDSVDSLWCWAHIRRYFIRAGDAHKELQYWTTAWTKRIAALYVAHKTLSVCEAGTTDYIRATAEFSEALDAIDTARKTEATDNTLHPAALKVLATLDNEWEGLSRHKDFLELPLDNNAAERALRNPVVMRKNCYGSGSVWAAELASRIWTITATAQLAGINPLTYLVAYLDACATAGGKPPLEKILETFLPWLASETDLTIYKSQPQGPDP